MRVLIVIMIMLIIAIWPASVSGQRFPDRLQPTKQSDTTVVITWRQNSAAVDVEMRDRDGFVRYETSESTEGVLHEVVLSDWKPFTPIDLYEGFYDGQGQYISGRLIAYTPGFLYLPLMGGR